VVYFYKYNNPSLDEDAKQDVFSRFLGDIKQKYGDKVILIPIAADNNVSAVNVIIRTYNISVLPTILIDEKYKITSLNNQEELEKYMN